MFNSIQNFFYSENKTAYLYETISHPIQTLARPIFALGSYTSNLLDTLAGRGEVYQEPELPLVAREVDNLREFVLQPQAPSNDFVITVYEEPAPAAAPAELTEVDEEVDEIDEPAERVGLEPNVRLRSRDGRDTHSIQVHVW